MKNKFLSLGFALTLLMVCVSSSYAAGETYSVWNGAGASTISPLTDVIEVKTANDLAGVAALSATTDFAGKTIELKANIDLNMKSWTPIGSAAKPFKGTFNGNGHLIRGIRAFGGSADGIGLFGHVGQGAKIRQLGVNGLIMAKSKRRVGAIAGVCDGAISECWSMAEIVASGNMTGGLVGDLQKNGSITDCYQSGLIYHAADSAGGIVGLNAGKLERVYSSGYAANDAYAIVGADAKGSYDKCYFDRKAYLQKSSIEGNKITPVDSTENMFHLFATSDRWINSATAYPMLAVFAGTDAAKLSVAPMFLETKATNPVEHANDVTLHFTVSIEGGIKWKCQTTDSEQWIKIDNATGNVKVVRPCNRTEVLVDVTLGTETRVVYMSPRRTEDLLPGMFVGQDEEADTLNYIHYYCHDSYELMDEEAYMKPAELGWLGEDGDYHYQVVRYIVIGEDTTVMDTMLKDANTNTYKHWFDTCTVPTDTAGHFIIRSYVHDNGCSIDWRENKTGFEYYVYGKFIPGMIVTKTDTIYLETVPTLVSTTGSEASIGGTGTVYYQWFVNGDSIHTQTGLELHGYPLSKPGTYNFTRGTRDSLCYTPEHTLENLGVYTVWVVEPVDPGEILNKENQNFCTVEEAKAYIVEATKATGGAGKIEYRWFMDDHEIIGAKAQNLPLSGLDLQAGRSYTFTREVQDDTRFTTWQKSRYSKTIHIMADLTPGAIEETELENYCFDAEATETTTATITINEKEAAQCEDGLEYMWVREPGNSIIGDKKELNYTFPMSEIELGTTYTYHRYVRNTNPDCEWEESAGVVTQYYGQAIYAEVTKTICSERLPYTIVHTDSDGKQTEHTFTYNGERWEVSDDAGECPADTVFIVETVEMPSLSIDTVVHVCQETGSMELEYTQLDGHASNTFRITFSPDMAKYMGRKDTVGTITKPGYIVLENMPPVGTGDCYLELEIGYTGDSGSDEDVCYSTPSKMRVDFSLGGYLHTKYDRVLFVDNNPDNGLITGGADKLKFVAYQWYKDGQILEGETKQYYHQGGASLSGIFYVMLIAEDGKKYRSCEVTLPTGSSSAPQQTSVYPIPADAGQTVTVEGFGNMQIVSLAGEKVAEVNGVEGSTTVNAPRIPGIYFVQIITEDGQIEIHKLIVK